MILVCPCLNDDKSVQQLFKLTGGSLFRTTYFLIDKHGVCTTHLRYRTFVIKQSYNKTISTIENVGFGQVKSELSLSSSKMSKCLIMFCVRPNIELSYHV